MNPADCPLCRTDGGLLIHRDALLRVVRVSDTPEHPAFYRVILNRHVAEFSALPADAQHPPDPPGAKSMSIDSASTRRPGCSSRMRRSM